ncbi:MAG: hypothetical protein EON52_05400 [Actinomycetales bacterium]|nr:MAG: hypothetical protein EON52_05400 [Actinomycetales bacterium]
MRRGEDGQVTVLTLGFLLVLVLLAAVVVNASDAYLERQTLSNLADGAALAAADGLDEADFYADQEVRLDPEEARHLVGLHLAGKGVRVAWVDVDDDRVSLRLERPLDLAITPPGWTKRPTIVAEASAALRTD